jgi:hypothetical protein
MDYSDHDFEGHKFLDNSDFEDDFTKFCDGSNSMGTCWWDCDDRCKKGDLWKENLGRSCRTDTEFPPQEITKWPSVTIDAKAEVTLKGLIIQKGSDKDEYVQRFMVYSLSGTTISSTPASIVGKKNEVVPGSLQRC